MGVPAASDETRVTMTGNMKTNSPASPTAMPKRLVASMLLHGVSDAKKIPAGSEAGNLSQHDRGDEDNQRHGSQHECRLDRWGDL